MYCPPNITLSDVWINNGTSECFMDTVTSSIIFGFLFLFGTIQLGMYRKYGTEIPQLPRSRLYVMHIVFTILIPVLDIIKFVLQATLFDDHEIYIYMVTYCPIYQCNRCHHQSSLTCVSDCFTCNDSIYISVFSINHAYRTSISFTIRSYQRSWFGAFNFLDTCIYFREFIIYKSWSETVVVPSSIVRNKSTAVISSL